MAVAIYSRKSIEREGSISCETQIEYCRASLKPDERDEQVIEFVDNGFSGGNVNRAAFQNMMRQVQAGLISKVIVYRLDRISRSLSDFVNILNTFKEYDVKFVSSQEAFDTGSPYGELIVKILAVFAEFERNSIISRITQAYEHRSEMGFYMGGRQPYGYELQPAVINNIKTKKFVPIAKETEHLQYIFTAYAQSGVTLSSLLKDLTAKIQPLPNDCWTTSKLSCILKNPIYVKADYAVYEYYEKYGANIVSKPEAFDGVHGLQLYGRTKHNTKSDDRSDLKLVVMKHEGIINSDIWIKCQHKLAKNRQIKKAASNRTSWLGGLLICKRCGRCMTTIKGKTAGKTRRYFSCTGKSHLKICAGPNVTIYAESIEDMVYKSIAEKLKTLKTIKQSVPKSHTAKINDLKNKLKEITLAESKLLDAMLNGGFNIALIEAANTKAENLKNDRLKLKDKIKDLNTKEPKAKTVLNLSDRWQQADFEEKRAAAAMLIHHIFIEEDGSAEIVWNI